MCKAVMILSPDMAREQNVWTWKIVSPTEIITHLHPLDMLVEHTSNDVNKRFIGVDKSMSTRQEITF